MPAKKVLYTVEYSLRSSPAILYNFLTTPSGLSQWFAEHVDINGDEINFTWDGSVDTAYIVEKDEDSFVRYRWDYQDEDQYFEFRITKSEITDDTILTVTDFCDDYEVEDQRQLWDRQITILKRQIGAG